MTSTDPIADMLTRIRNAIAVNKSVISLPHSNIKESIAKILKTNGFISGVSTANETAFKTLVIEINLPDANAKITELARLSTPGRRTYVRNDKIPVVKRGRGLVIISTSKGLMTGGDAKTQGLGGELICRIY